MQWPAELVGSSGSGRPTGDQGVQALAVAGLHKCTDSVARRIEQPLQIIESLGILGQLFCQFRIGLATRTADRGRGLGDSAAQGQSGQAIEQVDGVGIDLESMRGQLVQPGADHVEGLVCVDGMRSHEWERPGMRKQRPVNLEHDLFQRLPPSHALGYEVQVGG